MYKFILIGLLCAGSFLQAQTKKPLPKNKPAKAKTDSVRPDSAIKIAEEPFEVPHEFKAYTRRFKNKKEKTKLCFTLVNGDSVLQHCVNDSILHDPEVYKILFEAKDQDTTYSLVYVAAFSKVPDKPQCDAGKEVKLFFVRLNTATNKAIVKQKNIESCIKAITNMTEGSIENWDRSGPLVVSYHRGGSNFLELKFDPASYKLGMQSSPETESK
jgi:hypothetical protein